MMVKYFKTKNPVKVIFINGAPCTGKDEVSNYLLSVLKKVHYKAMKTHLIEWVCNFYNISLSEFNDNYTRDKKEIKSELFNGLSPREALIHVSENVIKPILGKSYFGDYMANNLSEGINVISDCGFMDELRPIIQKIGVKKCLLIKIKREGYNFSEDSRSEITDNYMNIKTININNNKELFDLFNEVDSKIIFEYSN